MSLIPIKSEKSERDQLVNHVFYPVCVQGRLRQALQSSGAEVFVLGIEPSQQGVKELNMESGGERNPWMLGILWRLVADLVAFQHCQRFQQQQWLMEVI